MMMMMMIVGIVLLLLTISMTNSIAIKYLVIIGTTAMDDSSQQSTGTATTMLLPTYNISADDELPIPLQLLRQYIHWHGVDALRKEAGNHTDHTHADDRKYAIAIYQCPKNAGNSLHHFANGLLYSILTNRTVLWHYGHDEDCLLLGVDNETAAAAVVKNLTKCQHTQEQIEACRRVLLRAPWIPSYHEWKDKIKINTSKEGSNDGDDDEPLFVVPLNLVLSVNRGQWPAERKGKHHHNETVDHYGIDNVTKYPQHVFVWPRIYSSYPLLSDETVRNQLLHTAAARERAKQLFSLGSDFLYGMLLRHSFQMTESILATVPTTTTTTTTRGVDVEEDREAYYTIALHSRHRYASLDGCDIQYEVDCLEQLLKARRLHSHNNKQKTMLPVRVSMMSDRPCTLSLLSTWLTRRNISVVVSSHTVEEAQDSDARLEHGPFPGAGYFVDLAMVVATAQDAVIVSTRSSSKLLSEFIDYDRIMRSVEQKKNIETLDKCILPVLDGEN
jgi:hypothetical protein